MLSLPFTHIWWMIAHTGSMIKGNVKRIRNNCWPMFFFVFSLHCAAFLVALYLLCISVYLFTVKAKEKNETNCCKIMFWEGRQKKYWQPYTIRSSGHFLIYYYFVVNQCIILWNAEMVFCFFLFVVVLERFPSWKCIIAHIIQCLISKFH